MSGSIRVLLSVLALGAAAPILAQADSVHHLARGGSRFELRLVVRESTLRPGWAGELVSYRVLKDGEFLHPTGWGGGRLFGIKPAYGYPSQLRVEPFPDDTEPEGWFIGVRESCGNCWSWRIAVVTLPRAGDPPGVRPEELVRGFKDWPIAQRTSEGTSIFGLQQDWGARGSTAFSAYIPFRLLAGRKDFVPQAALPADLNLWPASILADAGFVGAFVAGVRERNPTLMRAALDRLFRDDERDWYEGLGLPADRSELFAMITAVERIVAAEQQLRMLSPGIDTSPR